MLVVCRNGPSCKFLNAPKGCKFLHDPHDLITRTEQITDDLYPKIYKDVVEALAYANMPADIGHYMTEIIFESHTLDELIKCVHDDHFLATQMMNALEVIEGP